ncbi:MAG: ATP-binding protein [Nannocystaceae bacterium]
MGTPAEDAIAIVRELSVRGESYYVEYKSAWHYGPTGKTPRDIQEIAADIGKTIVAFANADGGDLLVGVEDDGAITGVPHEGDRLSYLLAWRQQVQTSDDADASVGVSSVEVDGQRVLLFRVEALLGDPLVTSDGRCMMREKKLSIPVAPRKIAGRRAHVLGDRDYEAQPVPAATLEDLDWELIRHPDRARPNRNQTSLFEDFERFDDVALLRYWNLVEQRNGNVVLRRAALLLFAKDPLRWHPNNRVRIRRVFRDEPGYGRQLGTRERELLGPIAKVLQTASLVLRRSLLQESREDQLFTTSQLLPRAAVDECLVNAVAHRNYAIEGQAVEVLFHPDRVEFRSPGRLPEPITIADLRAQGGVHRSRNPVMMRVLRDLGWTRDQGEGMARIFGSMRQVELHEPELEEVADTFTVRLSTRSVYDASTQAWIASYGPFGLEPEERRYIVALRAAGGRQSVDRLARQLDESFDQVKAALAGLERRHMVWHPKKSRSYQLVEPLNVPHERVYRALCAAKLRPSGTLMLDRKDIARISRSEDEHTTSALIDQWKQAGVIAPAGKQRWRLGSSFLEYLSRRDGSARA